VSATLRKASDLYPLFCVQTNQRKIDMIPVTSKVKATIAATGICMILLAAPASAADINTLTKAIQKIEQSHNAKTYAIEATEYKDRQVYEFETLRNGAFYESIIDPQSGQMLSDEKEEATFLWTPLNDNEKQAFTQTQISLWQAIDAVSEKNNSSIEEASFKVDNNKGYFEIIFEDGAKYLVNGMSGDVQKI